MQRLVIVWIMVLLLGACASRNTPAPIVNATAPKTAGVNSTAGGVANKNSSGTVINKIDLDDDGAVVSTSGAKTTPSSKVKTAPSQTDEVVVSSVAVAPVVMAGGQWLTPTKGKIIRAYTPELKGVDVSGLEGQDIVAAAVGKVVYSGNGLKGYGNLIIIKHQDNYLTAYSHNKVNLVREGDSVRQGQKIAELGKTESDKPVLHFELRKNGKPINPTKIFATGA